MKYQHPSGSHPELAILTLFVLGIVASFHPVGWTSFLRLVTLAAVRSQLQFFSVLPYNKFRKDRG